MDDRFAIILNSSRPDSAIRPPVILSSLLANLLPLKVAPFAAVRSPQGQTSGNLIFLNRDIQQLRQLSRKRLFKAFFRAGRKASRLGARIIGLAPSLEMALGGLAPSIARELKVPLTGGSGYTVVAAVEGLQKAAALAGRVLDDASVLLLGAADPRGVVMTQMLARMGVNYLTLSDRDGACLDLLSRRVLYDCGVACKISTQEDKALKRADLIIIIGKESPKEILPHGLKQSAIVCNMGAGDDLSLNIAEERPDVIIFDDVVIGLPGGAASGCELGLPGAGVFSWMAESILLALEGRYDRYFLGPKLLLEKVLEMKRLSEKHNFTAVGIMAGKRYSSFGKISAQRNRRS